MDEKSIKIIFFYKFGKYGTRIFKLIKKYIYMLKSERVFLFSIFICAPIFSKFALENSYSCIAHIIIHNNIQDEKISIYNFFNLSRKVQCTQMRSFTSIQHNKAKMCV